MRHIVLVGNPNCGKTTLFNALTGENQRIGNWPGVTVEKKQGHFVIENAHCALMDLPGVYSIDAIHRSDSPDQIITIQELNTSKIDLIINVLDAAHLERHLYLTTQLLEKSIPTIVVLNMIDIANNHGITIDIEQLSQTLKCPVIPIQAHNKIGIESLLQAILKLDTHAQSRLPMDTLQQADIDDELMLADARYSIVHKIIANVQKTTTDTVKKYTALIDTIVLNRYVAFPIFFLMIYSLFACALNIGGVLQTYVDQASDLLFVREFTHGLLLVHAPVWLIAVLAQGLGEGIHITITFIPVLAVLFFCLAGLEASGYMARAAFIVDKAMRYVGLPGKAFVPMIIGFGCNVPAILATRTLSSIRDRILTILMAPFMSCSARLAIYTVFVSVFFKQNATFIVFALYLIGIIAAIVTAIVLNHALLKEKITPLVIELPTYHCPSLSRLMRETNRRLWQFIVRAGSLILPISMLLGALNYIPMPGAAPSMTIMSYIGQLLTPLFAPLGIQASNWPATVGLLTGFLAKEVVIGSMNTLYSQMIAVGVGSTSLEVMRAQFAGQAAAFAYLLFVLLYVPCLSTMAVMRQEGNNKIMCLAISWSLLLAYTVSSVFYQIATYWQDPLHASMWILFSILMNYCFIKVLCMNPAWIRNEYATADM